MAHTAVFRPRIMGILNTTHDSFFSGSRVPEVDQAAARAGEMIADGADIIDVGGESTRPGSAYVDREEELRRVVPVIEAIHQSYPDTPISIDTRKAAVAEAALDAGASIVNDISALRDDRDMAVLVADRGVSVVLMHMLGTPKTMQQDPHYDDPVQEIKASLTQFAERALEFGIRESQLILDPGIGFGKRFGDNWEILRNIEEFVGLGYPILIGLSRKSFLGSLLRGGDGTPRPAEGRLYATLAAQLWCALGGVEYLRVHDVAAMADILNVWEALHAAGTE